ncbi:MAG: arginine repressor [Bacteroidota bacterium]
MASKILRQNKIKEILRSMHISGHEELVKQLAKENIFVTQATLSRDFAEMGVIRSVGENGIRYSINTQETGAQIARMIGFEIISVEHNESLILLRTLPGRAQGVAHFIDRLNKLEILGTVAGDDTTLVIPNSQNSIPVIVEFIKQMMVNQVPK